MRNLYTRHASTLPTHARDAIASLFGRDALDSRVCDLMTLSEWEDIFDGSAPRHADDCYVCSGDSPAYRADHEYTRVCDAIGHQYCDTDLTCYGCGRDASAPVMAARVTFDGQDTPPFTAYVEEGTWNGFTVAWMTLADLRAVTLDGGVTLFDSSMDSHLTYVEGEGIYEVSDVQTVPLLSRVIDGVTYYRMDGYTITRVPSPTLTPAAIEALSIILDVNDDDNIMVESGVPMEGLAILREIASTL